MNPALVSALEECRVKGLRVPIVYQYLHNPNKQLEITQDNLVGYVSNIHYVTKGEDSLLIGDVEIDDLLRVAVNFEGKVDNMMAEADADGKSVHIKAFIIYNKIAKDIINKKKEDEINKRLPRPGEIPYVGNHIVDWTAVNESIAEEFERSIQNAKI
jgi:hypothetical protein